MTERRYCNRRDGSTAFNIPDALTANQLDTTHARFAALSLDTQQLIRDMKEKLAQFAGGRKVVLRFKPYLEVFHLSKLLVPGIQLQIQMYLIGHVLD